MYTFSEKEVSDIADTQEVTQAVLASRPVVQKVTGEDHRRVIILQDRDRQFPANLLDFGLRKRAVFELFSLHSRILGMIRGRAHEEHCHHCVHF